MIVIVDYGIGNIGALLNMFDYLGIDACASHHPGEISRAERLVLPGVGAFDRAMSTLRSRELVEPLNEAVVERGAPVLGVCLGMQLLARRSEEGNLAGLGWIAADVRRITPLPGSALKVPHIGWSQVAGAERSPLFDGATEERFYFDHSYHVVCDDRHDIAALFDYGTPLCCAVHKGNVFGVQFHPEKSHRFGMRLLSAFAALPTQTNITS